MINESLSLRYLARLSQCSCVLVHAHWEGNTQAGIASVIRTIKTVSFCVLGGVCRIIYTRRARKLTSISISIQGTYHLVNNPPNSPLFGHRLSCRIGHRYPPPYLPPSHPRQMLHPYRIPRKCCQISRHNNLWLRQCSDNPRLL